MARSPIGMRRPAAIVFVAVVSVASAAPAETVEIFAAGSLRAVVNDLAQEAGLLFNIEVKSSLGGSRSMRELRR